MVKIIIKNINGKVFDQFFHTDLGCGDSIALESLLKKSITFMFCISTIFKLDT